MTSLLFTNDSSQLFTNDSGRLFTNDEFIVYKRLPPIVYPMSTWPIVYERLLTLLLTPVFTRSNTSSDIHFTFGFLLAIQIMLFKQWRHHTKACQGKCPVRNTSALAAALAVKSDKNKIINQDILTACPCRCD